MKLIHLIWIGIIGMCIAGFFVWYAIFFVGHRLIDATVKATTQPSVSKPIEQHGMLSGGYITLFGEGHVNKEGDITLSGGSHAKPLMWDPNKDCWVEDKE